MMSQNQVSIIEQKNYDAQEIARKISPFISLESVRRVFIKPNMVINPWKGEEDSWIATVTNSSIIEAALICLKNKAKGPLHIIVGDAPMARSRHEITLKLIGIEKIIEKYNSPEFTISLIDIRDWYWKYVGEMCVSRKKLKGDPQGVKLVNLYSDSCFLSKDNKEYEAFDDVHPVSEFHNDKDNIFSISASVLDCDLFINLPKMKTHRIAGMTCAMKNLVGINSNKNCVPHNTVGTDGQGGDACQQNDPRAKDEMKGFGGKVRRLLRKKNPIVNYCFVPVKWVYDKLHKGKETIGYGMWYGNDTIWRSIVDLNRIIMYADKNGIMHDEVQRKYLCIADAIISGEGEGPLHPAPIETDLLLVSDNPVAIDLTAAEIMGFDYKKIPSIYMALNKEMRWKLADFTYEDFSTELDGQTVPIEKLHERFSYHFKATSGWAGHIEK